MALTDFGPGEHDLVLVDVAPDRVPRVDAPEVDARERDAARLQEAPDVAVHRWVRRLRRLLRRLRWLRLLLGLLRVALRARVLVVHAVVDGVLFVHHAWVGIGKMIARKSPVPYIWTRLKARSVALRMALL